MVAELLASVALTFTGAPTAVHCPPRVAPGEAAHVVHDEESADLYMPRRTCRVLLSERPTREALDTFTHELIHIRFPDVRHGKEMQRAVRAHLPIVAAMIRMAALRAAYKKLATEHRALTS